MDSFLSRYRNVTVLLILIAAQLVLLGYQEKSNHDVRLLKVWSVWAFTPIARFLESTRLNSFGVFENYFVLLGVRDENRKLHDQIGNLRMQNQFLQTQLADAERARALVAFQAQTPSKTLPARVILNGTGLNSVTVFLDRGSNSGVENGMAVVTPEGIVGKVIGVYPSSSLVLLVTDPTFAAGVISQKDHVSGTLKGQGHGNCIVDYIQNEQKVETGEWFFTSGYDRVFPRGFPVGQVSAVRAGRAGKEVFLNPSGLQGGLEEVLIVLEGKHQMVPDTPPVFAAVRMMPLPGNAQAPMASMENKGPNTQADTIKDAYKKIGEMENHQYGIAGSVPNFNVKLPGQQVAKPPVPGAPVPQPPGTQTQAQTPGQTQAVTQQTASVPSAAGTAPLTSTKPAQPAPAGGAPTVAATQPKKPAVVPATPVNVPRKPRPVLETDPADADPSEPEILKSSAKPKAVPVKPSPEDHPQ
jgi:rod shape-determining protein MreC